MEHIQQKIFLFGISIHPLSIPAYPGQGRGRRWSLSQHVLGERQEYTLDTHTYGRFRAYLHAFGL
uniref:Uncharacterized protein n=1 Tax=Anguilla anguilla TaxID=7936 RepID=A0A0E9QKX7_ANGAN